MTRSALLLLIIPLAMGCSMTGGNAEKSVELIDNYVKAVESMDFDAMEIYLAEDYVGLGPSHGDSIGKIGAIENWKNNVEILYQSIRYNKSRSIPVTISTGDNQGDWVANWAELNIKYKDDKGEVTIWANTIYQIENEKIVKSYTFYNEADALKQLGYVFINPNEL